MKKQSFILNHGSYPFDVLVSIGHTDEDVIASLEDNMATPLSGEDKQSVRMDRIGEEGRTSMISSGQTVLRLALQKNPIDLHKYAAHEIFHAVEFLFYRVAVKHNMEISGEAFAYQIMHLTEQFYRHLKK